MADLPKKRQPAAKPATGASPGLSEKVERVLLATYAPPCLVVDDHLQIVHVSGPVSRYLLPPESRRTTKLSDSVPRDLGGSIQSALERLRTSGLDITRQTVFVGEPGARRSIDLVIRSLRGERETEEFHLVIFEDPAAEANAGEPATASSSAPASPADRKTSQISPSPAAPAGPRRILIIEDHVDAAEGMRLLLELKGYQVTVAHDGPAGVDKARQFQPEIVLCDIGLPGSMDGYAVARLMRSDPTLASMALVALTGYGQEKDQHQAALAGFDTHLTKPTDPGELIRVLGTLPLRN